MSEVIKKATRDGFGDEIVEVGKRDKRVYIVDADIGKSCKTTKFHEALPEQYLNVGIAEQNCAGVAAGLATCGKIPFVVTYAVFGSLRMIEMTVSAALISLVLSIGMIFWDSVKSYAASDFEQRLPGVQQRFYTAKVWILEKFIDEEEENQ